MNISQSLSQFTSGCESGWTHYLDQSYLSGNHQVQKKGDDYVVGSKFEEEEDLSMVSDASSGPPHYQEQLYEDGSSFYVDSSASKLCKKSKKKKKNVKESSRSKEQHQLDDTASSSVLNYYSKKNLSARSKDEPSMQNLQDYSEGFSATHMQGKSALLQKFEFFNSSLHSQKPGDFQGRRWE